MEDNRHGDRIKVQSITPPVNSCSDCPHLSIMVGLPGKNQIFCVGSNGASSMVTNLDGTSESGSGCPSAGTTAKWACPGCANDPTAKGM